MQRSLPLDGFCSGPLFAPPAKRRPAKPRMQSTYRDRLLRKRTPAWADRRLIAGWYDFAKRAGLSVDHMVPLNHPLVCGLHVEYNLQLIPLRENIAKSNNTWPDMPGEQMEIFE